MTQEVFWTVLFGLSATAIGLVTIWQNFQIVEIRRESKSRTCVATVHPGNTLVRVWVRRNDQ
jgi:hypothetical protein